MRILLAEDEAALRQEKNPMPVLLLTARSDIEDRVEGLDAGANDYLSKPFDIRELLARLRVLTRSASQQDLGGQAQLSSDGTASLQIIRKTVDTWVFAYRK